METETSHKGFEKMFAEARLTVGLVFLVEAYEGAFPTMHYQACLACLAEVPSPAAFRATEWGRDLLTTRRRGGVAGTSL